MATNEEYNGYPNRQTWTVNLWLTQNDTQVRILTEEATDVYQLADSLKDMVNEENPLEDTSDMYKDLLQSAIDRVEWDHLARNYWEIYR